ncbi:MAG: type II toxin-antitoxin system VapC family toxin [Flavobacteriales bacterium]|nr:type II toxin-antitoxin system VapC family toxin [Flavobacteriales bacterium]HRO40897.1 type II toxin-antitoxin system VapC family toxin [Flavobacteriales bacterium]HRP82838.1 type II toxin-antitoxin system VapC family toxin [Flavobacteriales bacterium]
MRSDSVVLDTNIVVYLFNGDQRLADQLEEVRLFISAMSRIELYSWRKAAGAEIALLDKFMQRCTLVEIDREVQDAAIALRRAHKLTVADAIVAASAQVKGIPLFTADGDFKRLGSELRVVIYER